MEVRCRKPVPVGIIPWPGKSSSRTVVIKRTFRLDRDGELEPAEIQVPLSLDHLHGKGEDGELSYGSDFAPYKPRVDVLLVGHARDSARQNVLPVSMLFGTIRKRAFAIVDHPTDAVPLFPRYLRAKPGSPVPVRFGPTGNGYPFGDPTAPSNENWSDPGFNSSKFNVAPEDQQLLKLPSRGRITIEGVFADVSKRVLQLPTSGAAAVLFDRNSGAVEHLAMRCDTVHLDADRGECFLLYRAVVTLAPGADDSSVLALCADGLLPTIEAEADLDKLVEVKATSPDDVDRETARNDVDAKPMMRLGRSMFLNAKNEEVADVRRPSPESVPPPDSQPRDRLTDGLPFLTPRPTSPTPALRDATESAEPETQLDSLSGGDTEPPPAMDAPVSRPWPSDRVRDTQPPPAAFAAPPLAFQAPPTPTFGAPPTQAAVAPPPPLGSEPSLLPPPVPPSPAPPLVRHPPPTPVTRTRVDAEHTGVIDLDALRRSATPFGSPSQAAPAEAPPPIDPPPAPPPSPLVNSPAALPFQSKPDLAEIVLHPSWDTPPVAPLRAPERRVLDMDRFADLVDGLWKDRHRPEEVLDRYGMDEPSFRRERHDVISAIDADASAGRDNAASSLRAAILHRQSAHPIGSNACEDLHAYAEVRRALSSSQSKSATLAEHGLDGASWRLIQRAWRERLRADSRIAKQLRSLLNPSVSDKSLTEVAAGNDH